MAYQRIKLKLTHAQQKKALRGAAIRLKADAIGTGYIVMLHPVNYRKLTRAKQGVMLELSPGEMIATASFHGMVPAIPAGMEGSGIFDTIWGGIKSVGKFLKDTGIASTLADVAQEAATPFIGETGAKLARNVVKGVTGVGVAPKRKSTSGSPARALRSSQKMAGAGLYL